ncbi:L-aspartate oxidase [Salinimicrobium marinum]|uniref:L-aspartate oxidase n=1 Tax=Salinimicrobium marinum TaxID=680283 RepID=A0A918SCP1_9FLAO|nr:L-aspartate oxidase [Salinimicrobium marinum]GHA34483.1 L-aspartate oxidase [Salinimicrobium marinum]
MKTDVLVIGSGIAGLSFAIKTAEKRPDLDIIVLTKNSKDVCNTAHAQGGMAVVLDQISDSFEQHTEDTIRAGKGLNERNIVEMVVSQAPERLLELIEWGAKFDEDRYGDLELGLEGGHSQKRIIHHRDLTGREIYTKLRLKAKSLESIQFIDNYFVTDLLVGRSLCTGVTVLDKEDNQYKNIFSKITFLASGGSGMIFENTTNPAVATADGLAMAYRAGASIRDMSYIQFHPTALYEKDKHPLFLISEAVRGFGAYVVNHKGNRFLLQHDHRGELATRDIVSEAIVKELKISGEKSAFLDCRHLDYADFQEHFPTIVSYCLSIGIDIRIDLIPIVPAAHYQCGGIAVDVFARTSVKNLYASGECAHTGLHGANRLASNSLLEALVFSHQAAKVVLQEIDLIKAPETNANLSEKHTGPEADPTIISSLKIRLNELMTYDLLYSSGKDEKEGALQQLLMLLEILREDTPFNTGTTEFYELRNMVQTAVLILEDAIQHSKSRVIHI